MTMRLSALPLYISDCHNIGGMLRMPPYRGIRQRSGRQLRPCGVPSSMFTIASSPKKNSTEYNPRSVPSAHKRRHDFPRTASCMRRHALKSFATVTPTCQADSPPSYYRKWWSDYPQNFDARLIRNNITSLPLHLETGAWMYGILPQNVGYIRIPMFSSGP